MDFPEREIFYVAYHKHGAPQHLEKGPFVDESDANNACEALNVRSTREVYCVVKQKITIVEVG